MARRYDSRTTIFSPEGRLYQVEYAMEAISHAGTCLGIQATDGILIAAENRNVHKLLDDSVLTEKIYRISDNMACTVAGITADANILINRLRQSAAVYKFHHGEPMPCEQLVQSLCNEKQRYTQIGGKRPFGVSLLYMGWDQHYGFQLYQSDPSGNYTGWKATCIGNNHQAAVSLFKQEYKNPDLVEAKKLAMKVLSKTLDVKLSADKVEMAVLTRRDNQTIIEELATDEITRLIKEHEDREREAELAAATGAAPSSSIDQDVLMQYGRELSSLKSILEVEKLKTAEEKLEAIERLPRIFPGEGQEVRKRKGTIDSNDDQVGDKVSNAVIKAQNEAIYRADIRRQLLSGGKPIEHTQNLSDIDFVTNQENQQTELSDELLRLTTALKTNVQVAGSVIQEDNQTINKMLHLSDQNKADLSKESQRLEQYTKRSCMDFMMIMMIVLVIWVFLGTVLHAPVPEMTWAMFNIHLILYTILFSEGLKEISSAGVKTSLPKAKQHFKQHHSKVDTYADDYSGQNSAEKINRYWNYNIPPFSPNHTEEQKLLYHLLRQYERAVRPVRNASHTITVKLGMTLTNIFDMDEKNQVLTINVWLDQEWKDELLRWDPAKFGGIESLRIPCDLLWLPDIVLYNNADDYTEGYMRSRAMVFYDGTVFWPPPTQLRSTCKISVTYFPFDSQRCSLKFGSWTYHGFQVDITNRSANVDLTNYVVSGEFDLIKVHQKRRVVKYTCCPELYPDVTFYIHIRRKTLYYMYNVIFPCLMMSVLTLLVFLLPPDSGEKISLGITVLLAFSVFVLAIAEKMPETSDSMPLIAIYLTVVMGMSSVSVVMTVLVLNFHHRGPFNQTVPPWIRYFILVKLRSILGMKLSYISDDHGNCNGIIRKTSTKFQLDNMVLGNSMTEQVEKEFFQETELIGIENGGDTILRKKAKKLGELHSRLLRTLQTLIKRQEAEDLSQRISNEWRQVAQVIDRFLFWIFFLLTIIITTILLLIIPIWQRTTESTEFDEAEYGLH